LDGVLGTSFFLHSNCFFVFAIGIITMKNIIALRATESNFLRKKHTNSPAGQNSKKKN